jgi:RNA polymerase sigma-70 factor (ECF subfamily)
VADDLTDFECDALSHLQSLFAVAGRLTRGTSESEDLVQDTLVKAIRAQDQFEPGTNLKAWLLRILTNTFINSYRRGSLERSIVDGADSDTLSDAWLGTASLQGMRDPESIALRPMIEAEINRAMAQLPDEFRLAVVLADVEELSYREIADIMGCPIGTVMSRLHRGRQILRSKLIDHARALGIIPEDAGVEYCAQDALPRPASLDDYRSRRTKAI